MLWLVFVVGPLLAGALGVLMARRRHRRRLSALSGAGWEPGMPSRLRDPETGEFL